MAHPMKHVIVVLPGIMGSVLKKHGKVVWGYSAVTIGKALLTLGRSAQRDLALPHDDPDDDDLGDGIVADGLMPDLHLLAGFWKIDGYGALERTLVEQFELTPGENYFRFPYDWRRDNRVAARKLQRAIEDWLPRWRKKSGAADARVIFLAHSMGGLVSRYYIECLGGWEHTKALVTFGTPYSGSLNAVNTLANGLRMKAIDLSGLARQLTGIYQLLPTYECITDNGKDFKKVHETDVPNIDRKRAAAAYAFHQTIADAVTANRSDKKFRPYAIYPIVGVAQATLQAAHVAGGNVAMLATHPADPQGVGDGTVPRLAAIPPEMEKDEAKKAAAMNAGTKHGSLQNANAVHVHVVGALSAADLKGLGAFRKIQTRMSLELPDLALTTEPIPVRVRGPKANIAVTAMLHSHDGGVKVARDLRTNAAGTAETDFGPQPAGAYTLTITGKDIETAEDAVAVVEPEP